MATRLWESAHIKIGKSKRLTVAPLRSYELNEAANSEANAKKLTLPITTWLRALASSALEAGRAGAAILAEPSWGDTSLDVDGIAFIQFPRRLVSYRL